ncbi:MAG: GGDEF domain-containing response regulator, partial [Myxococcota bacterium]
DIEVIGAKTGADGIALALREAEGCDLILLDYELPDTNGIDVLKRLRVDVPEIPVVFATSNYTPELLKSCFDSGAADYVRKPFVPAELRARVTSVIDRAQMVKELERAAYRDPLTGLFNRRSIRDRLQACLDRHTPYGPRSSLLFLDFDRFKIVNDSLGHEVGDLLLQSIASRLDAPPPDMPAHLSWTAARLGGDEFVVLLDEARHEEEVLGTTRSMQATLAAPHYAEGQAIESSASIGVVFANDEYERAQDMLRDADTAMYEAKKAGRGKYVVFCPEMRQAVEYRMRLEIELRDAIRRQELEVYYQPIHSLESGRVASVEALIRWRHPQRGLVSPADFIPVAEETNMILEIGEWVLERSCRDLITWREHLGESAPKSVHVNLSRRQLHHPQLSQRVRDIVAQTGLPAKDVYLEVTEDEVMQEPTVAAEVLTSLRDEGFRIAIDDFGTGYSSLACLHEFPIDVLKIDRSFVSRIDGQRGLMALLHAVCTLARNLDLSIVAEGVEESSQLALLQSLDCDFGQGYFFSRPLPAPELEPYFKRYGGTAEEDAA